VIADGEMQFREEERAHALKYSVKKLRVAGRRARSEKLDSVKRNETRGGHAIPVSESCYPMSTVWRDYTAASVFAAQAKPSVARWGW